MKITDTSILLVGGASNIASHIVDQLISHKPRKILVLDNYIQGNKGNLAQALKRFPVEIVNGDVRDTTLVHQLVKQSDAVFHLAAIRITRCVEDPRLCHEILIDGLFNVLEACARFKTKKIVFSSSASVYGDPSYIPMDEKHPFNNTTYYGAAKIASEAMIQAYGATYSIPYVILRYFNVYGPRMDIFGVYTEVLIKWIEKIERNESPIIHGDGSQALDFVYVGDVAQANIRALESSIEKGVYNVGTGRSTSLKELLGIVLELTHSDLKPEYILHAKRPYVQRRQADITKAEKELGFIAKTDIRQGLIKLLSWRKTLLDKHLKK